MSNIYRRIDILPKYKEIFPRQSTNLVFENAPIPSKANTSPANFKDASNPEAYEPIPNDILVGDITIEVAKNKANVANFTIRGTKLVDLYASYWYAPVIIYGGYPDNYKKMFSGIINTVTPLFPDDRIPQLQCQAMDWTFELNRKKRTQSYPSIGGTSTREVDPTTGKISFSLHVPTSGANSTISYKDLVTYLVSGIYNLPIKFVGTIPDFEYSARDNVILQKSETDLQFLKRILSDFELDYFVDQTSTVVVMNTSELDEVNRSKISFVYPREGILVPEVHHVSDHSEHIMSGISVDMDLAHFKAPTGAMTRGEDGSMAALTSVPEEIFKYQGYEINFDAISGPSGDHLTPEAEAYLKQVWESGGKNVEGFLHFFSYAEVKYEHGQKDVEQRTKHYQFGLTCQNQVGNPDIEIGKLYLIRGIGGFLSSPDWACHQMSITLGNAFHQSLTFVMIREVKGGASLEKIIASGDFDD